MKFLAAFLNLARHIIRASFPQERMTYIPDDESADGVAKVIYDSKDGKTAKTLAPWIGPAGRRDINTRPTCDPYPQSWRADGQLIWLLFKYVAWITQKGWHR